MKRLFSIMLVGILAISANATPQVKIGCPNRVMRSTEIGSTTFDKKARPTTMPALATTKVASASTAADTIRLNFTGFKQLGYYEQYNDWYMEIEGTDPSQPEYGYRVVFAYYAPSDNFCGTFSVEQENIHLQDSYLYNPTKGYVEYEDAVLTVEQKNVSASLKQIIATATVLGSDGVVYQINCIHNNITPKAEITATLPNATLDRDEESLTLAANDSVFDISITIHSASLLGQFSTKNIDLQNSYFAHNDDTLSILSIQAAIKAQHVGNDLACVAQVAFLTQDTIQYILNLVHTLPAPTDTANVICTNLDVDGSLAEYIGVVNFEAHNDDYLLSGTWATLKLENGTYVDENVAIELLDMPTGTDVVSLAATLHVAIAPTGHWTITGVMRGDNNKVYNLDLSYVVPVPEDTVIVRFKTSSNATFYPDFNNDLLLDNSDEHFQASLNIRGVEMDDTFTIFDVDKEYCGVKDLVQGKITELADVNGRIYQSGDTTIMQAELISMDATLYDIELWYVAPTPIDTVELAFPVEFGDLRSEQGFYQLYGPSLDTAYVVAFSPMSDEIEGTFVIDGMFGRFGAEGGRYEMAANYTYIALIADGMVLDLMPIEKGEMVVEMDEEGYITAVASVICRDKILYNITMTSKYERVYLRGDQEEGSVEKTYTAADQLFTEDYSKDGYVYMAILSHDMTDLTALHIFVDSTDADILVPEGTYEINKSYRPGTVLANVGLTNDNVLQTPFYATCDIMGNILEVYMWVKGTVVFSKNEDGKLRMEVNAVNSYDVPIHIIYDASLTAIENVATDDADTAKIIRNGQLMIIRNGKKYNVLGSNIE